MAIQLRKEAYLTSFHDPTADYACVQVLSEIRHDPLTGGQVRICPPKVYKLRPHDWGPYIEKSLQRFCPFCPGALENSTPYFPAALIPEGRIRVGGATIIPNMTPYDLYAAVVVMSPLHYVAPPDLVPGVLTDSLTAALAFLDRLAVYDPARAVYASINWNYMPYSGGSIIHPHLQVLAGPLASRYQAGLLKGEEEYFSASGRYFWDDLAAQEEALGERYLGRTGQVQWLAYWAPRALVDIAAVLPCSAGIETGHIADLCAGFGKLMAYFNEINIASFNAGLHLAPAGHRGHRITFRVGGRFTTFPVAGSDITFLQLFHDEPWTPWEPEKVAREARDFFRI
ncbi:MAG: hypothetical protein M0Z41_10800 [Peptococcaceae bacterium]|jgi:galactose-1-phosphate uridylyltransferase|nr:hypothetical protein [Peptococcaceae bacterium]